MQIALFPYVRVMGYYAHVATTKEFDDSFCPVAVWSVTVCVASVLEFRDPIIDEGSIKAYVVSRREGSANARPINKRSDWRSDVVSANSPHQFE